MSEMIERLASAILNSGMVPSLSFPDDYEKLARIVIEAMREPVGDMCWEGARAAAASLGDLTHYQAKHVWGAMIDEALK